MVWGSRQRRQQQGDCMLVSQLPGSPAPRTVRKEDAISQLRPCPPVPLSSLLKTSISKGSLERERNLLMATECDISFACK